MANPKGSKLSRTDLLSMAIGQIIGVGIMTMTGVAIGFTGRSVSIAYVFAGLIVILSAIPQIYIGGTANFPGGQYSQLGTLLGKKIAGIFIYIQLFTTLAISMFTLSFAHYFISIFPGVNEKLICVSVLTILTLMHVVGIKQAARLQNILVIVLAVAIAAYIAFGIGNIQPDYFTNGFLTGGPSGFILACVYLTFAAGGATYIVNFSAEAENPTKDIPFVIIISTIIIAVIYAVMSAIASGSVPVEVAANAPLSVSAITFMHPSVYTFFVVGGAMFALLTTLNFNIGMLVHPIMKAAEDGWLPKVLTKRNKKFGSAHVILLIIYLIGTVPILFNLDITTIANSTVILFTCIRAAIAFAATKLPTKMGEVWDKSSFKTSNIKLNIICWAAIVISIISILILLISSSTAQIIGNIGILVFSVVMSLIMNKKINFVSNYTDK